MNFIQLLATATSGSGSGTLDKVGEQVFNEFMEVVNIVRRQ